jgi:DNA primase small subunit
MRPATLEFLKQRFSEYYRKGVFALPPALEQREWGFIFFDPLFPEIRMRRHIGFGSKSETVDYLRTMVPAHVYYSSAYYATPAAGSMQEKGWAGADLIFDLDADHIIRVRDYSVMLARVKQETEKLLAMLTDELGFNPRSISVVFSGGRGYHIHIREIGIRGWNSQERRELVDYVCGIGLDPGTMLAARPGQTNGWPRRYRRAFSEYLRWLLSEPRAEAIKHLTVIEGIGDESAEKLLAAGSALLDELDRGVRATSLSGRFMQAMAAGRVEAFTARLRETAALADEPVTTDIKRLIRMPTSLHGGSGLRVVPLAAGELAGFDPLVDAVVFGEREVKVEMNVAMTMSMLGNTYQLGKGERVVPEALAVFLACRGFAEMAGGGRRGS